VLGEVAGVHDGHLHEFCTEHVASLFRIRDLLTVSRMHCFSQQRVIGGKIIDSESKTMFDVKTGGILYILPVVKCKFATTALFYRCVLGLQVDFFTVSYAYRGGQSVSTREINLIGNRSADRICLFSQEIYLLITICATLGKRTRTAVANFGSEKESPMTPQSAEEFPC